MMKERGFGFGCGMDIAVHDADKLLTARWYCGKASTYGPMYDAALRLTVGEYEYLMTALCR
jgi:hypothetical protein